MPAAWPWHGRRASPPSVSGPAPQTLEPPIKPLGRHPETLAAYAISPRSAIAPKREEREEEEERKGGEREEEQELREGEKDDATAGAPPGRRPVR
jgi:hypothetical protein